VTRARRDVLLDTGPLVALLDKSDPWHPLCAEAWGELGARCVTTEAVVTEATHLVGRGGGPPALVLEFLLAVEVSILGLDTQGHRRAALLMRQYQDTPMDYADATLVIAAEWLEAGRVFTLDRRGFRTYRRSRGAAFTLLPPG
jgi:hypothetical protein